MILGRELVIGIVVGLVLAYLVMRFAPNLIPGMGAKGA